MLAVFVALTSTVEFHINAMCIGGVPETEHDKRYPGNTCTTAACKIITGGADEKQLAIKIGIKTQSTFPCVNIKKKSR